MSYTQSRLKKLPWRRVRIFIYPLRRAKRGASIYRIAQKLKILNGLASFRKILTRRKETTGMDLDWYFAAKLENAGPTSFWESSEFCIIRYVVFSTEITSHIHSKIHDYKCWKICLIYLSQCAGKILEELGHSPFIELITLAIFVE